MPLALGAWICARVAEGLHSAHALRDDEGALLQVIHRDVNPSNVFLTYDGQVKLIDFGLSRARKRSAKTGDGIVKGKIPYLAPEQATHGPIDRRIDVFALGATLWEVCTGRRLFKRETDAETLQAVRDANIPDVQALRPEVPEALAKIVHRALAIAPDERFGTAAELQRELDAFVDAKVDRKAELSEYLEQRFPGERARQLAWVKAASAPRKPMATLAPPVPIGLDTAEGARGGSLGPHTRLPESAITGAFPTSAGGPNDDEPTPRFSASPAKRVAVAFALVAAIGILVALALRQ
jgi:eukaryotic-like serine/threonine-protein kinase